jgi:peptide/nickel transport system substrate-binding protein
MPRELKMIRRIFTWPLAAALILSIIAIKTFFPPNKKQSSPENGLHRGGKITIGWTTPLESVNPLLLSNNVSDDEIISQLFLSLRKEQPDYTWGRPRFEPLLAKGHIDWSDDHRTLTFHLRTDVLWSDGTRVTADDVKWTWLAQTDRSVEWVRADSKKEIEDVEVVNSSTVKFHFLRAYSRQLADAVEGPILPKHVWEKIPFAQWRTRKDWFKHNLVTDGPFTIASLKPDLVILRKNQLYWNSPWPLLDQVNFRIIPDPTELTKSLFANKIDFTPQIPLNTANKLDQERFNIKNYYHRLVVGIAWNNQPPPLNNFNVRRALATSINRTRIVDALFNTGPSSVPYGRLADSPIGSSFKWAHYSPDPPLKFDPESSRHLLIAQGFEQRNHRLEWHGLPFLIEILVNRESQEKVRAANMIASDLKNNGIDSKIKIVDFKVLQERLESGLFQAALLGFSTDTSLDFRKPFFSKSARKNGNYVQYNNPDVDAQIIGAANAMHDDDFVESIIRIQKDLNMDQPWTWLWESKRLNAVNRRLHDVRPNAVSSLYNLEEWWLDPGETSNGETASGEEAK